MVKKPNSWNLDAKYPIEEGAPFGVEPFDETRVNQTPDYIMPDGTPLPPETTILRKPQPHCEPNPDPNEEHVLPEVVKERKRKRNEWVKKEAKRIYAESVDKLRTYEDAKRLVEAASPEQLANPNPALVKAKKMVDIGPPMTKQDAIRLAKDKVKRKN